MKVAIPLLAGVVTFLLALASEALASEALASEALASEALASEALADPATSGLVTWAFDEQAIKGCLKPVVLKAEVESRLGRSVFAAEGALDVGAAILLRTRVSRTSGLYAIGIELVLEDGTLVGKRDLTAPSCEELNALVPVVVSLLLEGEGIGGAPVSAGAPTDPLVPPSASFPLESVAISTAMPVAPDPSEQVPLDVPETASSNTDKGGAEVQKPAPPDASLAREPGDGLAKPQPAVKVRPQSPKAATFWCGAAGGVLLGYGPAPTARARLGCSYAPLAYFNLELSGEVRLPSAQSDPSFVLHGFGGRLAGCTRTKARLKVGPCLGISVVQTLSEAELAMGSRVARDRVAVEGSGFLRVEYLAWPVVFQFDVGASFPSEQPRHLEVLPGGGEVLLHQPWAVLPSLDFGVGYIFR